MYTYNFFEWIFIFYVYCFIGWIIESSIVSFRQKRFVNRGFLRIPMLPIYGTGAILVLLICLPIKNKTLLVFVVGMIAATILEYITGWLMEKIFKIKYWDYSEDKFNLHGRICLESSLFWGVLSVVLTIYVHKPINGMLEHLDSITLNFITIIISCIFMTDVVYSICNVIHFNKTLIFINRIKGELETLHEEFTKAKNNSSNKAAYILNKRLNDLYKEYEGNLSKVKYFHKQLRESYPGAISKRFNNELKELKERLESKYTSNKK